MAGEEVKYRDVFHQNDRKTASQADLIYGIMIGIRTLAYIKLRSGPGV